MVNRKGSFTIPGLQPEVRSGRSSGPDGDDQVLWRIAPHHGQLRILVSIAAGWAGAALVLYAGVFALTRHVDKGFEARYIALHERWIAQGVKPGGEIADADAPPRGTDW
jgi:hypothetical protein